MTYFFAPFSIFTILPIISSVFFAGQHLAPAICGGYLKQIQLPIFLEVTA
jgi:hypothetical protein